MVVCRKGQKGLEEYGCSREGGEELFHHHKITNNPLHLESLGLSFLPMHFIKVKMVINFIMLLSKK